MKKISVLFAAIFMLMATSLVSAQKIATLDVASIINLMPEKKKADTQLEAFSKAKDAELRKQSESAQTLLKKYSEEASKQSADENKKREAELKKLDEDLTKAQMAAQKELIAKQDAAYGPIEKKFYDAVDKVAKANGWEYVMDSNSSAFVYKGGPDATAAVKKELGL